MTNSTTISTVYYKGIIRPTVDKFINGTDLVLTNFLAYSCTSKNKDSNEGLTNFIFDSEKKVEHFIDINHI